jgi:hypothetical protein
MDMENQLMEAVTHYIPSRLKQFDSDDDEDAPSIFEQKGRSKKKHCDNDPNTFLSFSR